MAGLTATESASTALGPGRACALLLCVHLPQCCDGGRVLALTVTIQYNHRWTQIRIAQGRGFPWRESVHRTVSQSKAKPDRSPALSICVHLWFSSGWVRLDFHRLARFGLNDLDLRVAGQAQTPSGLVVPADGPHPRSKLGPAERLIIRFEKNRSPREASASERNERGPGAAGSSDSLRRTRTPSKDRSRSGSSGPSAGALQNSRRLEWRRVCGRPRESPVRLLTLPDA